MNEKPDPYKHTQRDDRKESVRRAEKAHTDSKPEQKGVVARFFEKLLD